MLTAERLSYEHYKQCNDYGKSLLVQDYITEIERLQAMIDAKDKTLRAYEADIEEMHGDIKRLQAERQRFIDAAIEWRNKWNASESLVERLQNDLDIVLPNKEEWERLQADLAEARWIVGMAADWYITTGTEWMNRRNAYLKKHGEAQG